MSKNHYSNIDTSQDLRIVKQRLLQGFTLPLNVSLLWLCQGLHCITTATENTFSQLFSLLCAAVPWRSFCLGRGHTCPSSLSPQTKVVLCIQSSLLSNHGDVVAHMGVKQGIGYHAFASIGLLERYLKFECLEDSYEAQTHRSLPMCHECSPHTVNSSTP